MTHLFIINPAAGKRDRTEELTPVIHNACASRGLRYHIAVSKNPGDCRRIAREAAISGSEYRIYACGGDGTLNEIVSGVAGCPNVSVTHYAGGSGNDFVRIFSDTAPFHDLERLLDSQESEFDLIRCNDTYALNMCTVGLDARIGAGVARYKRLPLITGSGAYLLSALVETVKGVSRHYVVEVEGETIDGEQTMVVAISGRYYGGGFNPVPDADPGDGLLDILLVKKVTRLQILNLIDKYKNGRYADYPEVIRHLRTDKLTIHCDTPTSFNLDGEIVEAKTMHIRVAQEKLRFFYPKGLTYAKETEPAL